MSIECVSRQRLPFFVMSGVSCIWNVYCTTVYEIVSWFSIVLRRRQKVRMPDSKRLSQRSGFAVNAKGITKVPPEVEIG